MIKIGFIDCIVQKYLLCIREDYISYPNCYSLQAYPIWECHCPTDSVDSMCNSYLNELSFFTHSNNYTRNDFSGERAWRFSKGYGTNKVEKHGLISSEDNMKMGKHDYALPQLEEMLSKAQSTWMASKSHTAKSNSIITPY